ncbi:MAG TPA: DUF5667 domain-containing protein [Candidatus Woesebacteria bacterium]|nr:DUF5667 domain-containing protein [Candidatus Woesebacteria bacterium]
MHKVVSIILIIIFSFFLLPQIALITQSQSLHITEPEVVYALPYPGILSDHPLYFVKEMRDSLLVFTTRDNLKKAQLYLHLSDKRMAIALELAQKGKGDLAKKELLKAEEHFLEIPPLLKDSKEQGTAAPAEFISKLKESNAKHKSVITEVMKEVSDAEVKAFKTILDKNNQVQKEIQQL